MQSKLVKLEADEDMYMVDIRADKAHQIPSVHLFHRTKVLIYLVKPWRNTWQTVCADYYFVSVPAVYEIDKIELHFVGVVKTATKKYPMHFLNRNYLHECGV